MSGGGAVPSIIVLKRLHFKRVRAQGPDRLRRRVAGRRRRIIGDVGAKRRGADRLRILQRLPPPGGVEDQLHVAVLDPVDDMRAAFGALVDADRKSTRLNSRHSCADRMPSYAWKKQTNKY